MRRDVARHRSYSDHYGALAHCALCQSPSALKLIDEVFICDWCLLGRDSVKFSVPDGGSEVVRSTPPARPCPGTTQLSLLPDMVAGDRITDTGGCP